MKKLDLKKTGSILLSLIIAVSAGIALLTDTVIHTASITVNAETYEDYLYNNLDDGTIEITGYHGEGDVVIPSELYGKKVTSIAERAFRYNQTMTSVTIPESVTSIGDYAFSGCTNLETIIIPEGDLEIEEWVFEGTKWLNDQPDGCVYLGENDHILYCYKGIMPENTSVTVKDGTKHIAGTAFTYVSGNEVTSYQELVSVELPSGLKTIGSRAFQECININALDIPDGVKKIGRLSFFGCSNLSTLHVPDSVAYIGWCAFSTGAPWVKEYPDGAVYLGNVLYDYKGSKDELTSIDIKPGTTCIAYDVFRGCKKLKAVTIPDGIASIEEDAFSGCTDLTTVTIPESLKNIRKGAFDICDNLKEVIYTGTKESFDSIIIDEYVREKITPLMKYEKKSADESSESSQPEESTESTESLTSGKDQSSSEQTSNTESRTTSIQASNTESKTASAQASNTKADINSNSTAVIIGIISAVLIVGIIAAVIIVKNKSRQP